MKKIIRLTRREIEVLEEIKKGRRNREIAQIFVISEATVINHVHNILRKLGASNRTEASFISRKEDFPKNRGKHSGINIED